MSRETSAIPPAHAELTRRIDVAMGPVHWEAFDTIVDAFGQADGDRPGLSPAQAAGRLLGAMVGKIARDSVHHARSGRE